MWLTVLSLSPSTLLATVVEGDQKAPFSIATTPRCRVEGYSFSWIAPLYLRYVPYIAECWARRYQVPFLKFWYDVTWDWTHVSRTIGEHSTHWANEPVFYSYGFDGFNSPNLQFVVSLFQVLEDWLEGFNHNSYHHYLHVLQLFQRCGKTQAFVQLFIFFHFHSLVWWQNRIHKTVTFLLVYSN